jgi:transposase
MNQKKNPEKVIREIRRKSHRKFTAEEKNRIILEGLCGEESIAILRSIDIINLSGM